MATELRDQDDDAGRIDLEAPDGPQLEQEGAEPAPIETGQPPPPELVLGWTPEQAADMCAGVLYAGLMLYYVSQRGKLPSLPEFQALAVKGSELPSTGRAMVPLLDRFLPISGVGGVAAAGVSMLAVPAELAVVVIKRQDITYQLPDGRQLKAPLLRKTERPPVRPSQAQAPAAPFASPPPAAPTEADEAAASAFRFDRQTATVLDGRGDSVSNGI